MTAISDMVGKTFVKVKQEGDEIKFVLEDGTYFVMYHCQDCCEDVFIDTITGDLSDLENTPILVAEERNADDEIAAQKLLGLWKEKEHFSQESETWTFYTFRTLKGSVDIRWYGTSNGYYSESVDVEFYNEDY